MWSTPLRTFALVGAVVPVVIAAATGCDHDCLQVGCISGILINFDRHADPGTVVSLDVGGNAPWEVVCGPQTCGTGVHFPDIYASRATITISLDADTVVYEVFPDYGSSEINGPGCGICSRATLDLALP